MYVVTGASGNTGQVVANRLLDAGKPVRVIGRHQERLQGLVARGAQAVVADLTDQDALLRAFKGADALYAMIPPNATSRDPLGDQRRVGAAISAALKQSDVKYVVLLSSVGADKSYGTGPVVGLHEFEQMLDQIEGLNVVHLRPGYFMENTLGQAGAVAKMGYTVGLLRSDLKLPLIATKDIGNRVADLLLDLSFQGRQTQELLGHADLTMVEVSKIIGQSVGKPDLRYEQLPPEKLKPVMQEMGMSSQMADSLVEMSVALNSSHMRALEHRSVKNTTPTSYEAFVKEVWVPFYRQQSQAA